MFFGQVAQVVSFMHPQADDDFTDRMHYYYTSTFLMISAVRSSMAQVKLLRGFISGTVHTPLQNDYNNGHTAKI